MDVSDAIQTMLAVRAYADKPVAPAADRKRLATAAAHGGACHGDPGLAQRLSRTLVARTGALLPLIDDDFGPLYLERFVHEKTVSVNTTAAGGNAALMSQAESE